MDPINIKFGTDGWRAIIPQDYTVDSVYRLAETRKFLDAGRAETGI